MKYMVKTVKIDGEAPMETNPTWAVKLLLELRSSTSRPPNPTAALVERSSPQLPNPTPITPHYVQGYAR